MNEFAEKVAIVAGGAQGIGRALAHALARLGARVLIADSGCAPDGTGEDPQLVTRAAEELARGGHTVSSLALDLAKPEAPGQLVEEAKSRYGRVDMAVYCAGFAHERPLLRVGEAELERVLAVHLFGALRFTRAVADAMIAGKTPGGIVLLSSAAGLLGSSGHSALATAAGGLLGYVKTAATELRRHQIRVNAVLPTARTRLTAQLPLFSSIRGDSLTPEHVAQGIVYLLSEAAADVRGEIIGIAGGRIYAYRHAETSGAFLEENTPATLEAIGAAWRDVTRR